MSKPATGKELLAVAAVPFVLWALMSKLFPAPQQDPR